MNPVTLPVRRLVNLTEYALTDGLDEKGREKWDRAFAEAVQAQEAAFDGLAGERRTVPGRAVRRPPAWWHGDEEEARNARVGVAEHAGVPRGSNG